MLASHGRYPCAPFTYRPDFQWPDGKRLAVYLAVNVEHFPYGEPGGIDLDRPTLPWSQRSWLWRDYGNRVGGWKLLDLFEDLQVPVGVIVNTANYHHNPELLEAHRQRGDEIIAHGRSNAERQLDMTEADERTMIAEVTQTLVQHTGQRPAGWLSPYLTPSLVTSDLLAEAGYTYVLDWGICSNSRSWFVNLLYDHSSGKWEGHAILSAVCGSNFCPFTSQVVLGKASPSRPGGVACPLWKSIWGVGSQSSQNARDLRKNPTQ